LHAAAPWIWDELLRPAPRRERRVLRQLLTLVIWVLSVGKQIVNVPSFIVRLDSQKHIDFALTSPFGGGRPGRVKRKKAKAAEKKDEDGEDEDEE
jgi:hypothetical protein